jgi:hypothetical protein
MPITAVHMRQRPTNPRKSHATRYLRVAEDVFLIIEIDKRVMDRFSEDEEDDPRQRDRDR